MTLSTHGFMAASIARDLDLDATVEVLATVSTTIFGIEIDNRANSADSFVKIWDIGTSVTLGTTDPNYCFKVEKGSRLFQPFSTTGLGVVLDSGLAIACVTTGGTGGTTSPISSVKATIATD